jgi:hypothetical protein
MSIIEAVWQPEKVETVEEVAAAEAEASTDAKAADEPVAAINGAPAEEPKVEAPNGVAAAAAEGAKSEEAK